MAGVYSTRFFLGAAVSQVEYIVPAGKRAVIKSVSAVNGTAAAVTVFLNVAGAAIWGGSVPGGLGAIASELMLVVNAGERIVMLTTGAQINMHASGYLLDTT